MTAEIHKLVRHPRKPEWGVGELVSQDEGRTSYRFDDGETRRFTADGLALLERVDESEVVRPKRGGSSSKKASESASAKPQKVKPEDIPVQGFEEQVEIFRALYPQGFADERYVEERRGVGGAKPTRVERQLLLASEVFEKEALRTILIMSRGKGMLVPCRRVLAQEGGLIPVHEGLALSQFLSGVPDDQRFAEEFFSLLFGKSDLAQRIDDFFKTIHASSRSWGIVSALLSLTSPEVHAPIDSQLMSRQLALAGMPTRIAPVPNGAEYLAVQAAIRSFYVKLMEADLIPRDLLDVHLFAQCTLAPDAKKKAARAVKNRQAEAAKAEVSTPSITSAEPKDDAAAHVEEVDSAEAPSELTP
ncbi:MAG: hypothetical protein U0165_15245 [Polyangiaceae bacterium]